MRREMAQAGLRPVLASCIRPGPAVRNPCWFPSSSTCCLGNFREMQIQVSAQVWHLGALLACFTVSGQLFEGDWCPDGVGRKLAVCLPRYAAFIVACLLRCPAVELPSGSAAGQVQPQRP